jgi:hypothetical protein
MHQLLHAPNTAGQCLAEEATRPVVKRVQWDTSCCQPSLGEVILGAAGGVDAPGPKRNLLELLRVLGRELLACLVKAGAQQQLSNMRTGYQSLPEASNCQRGVLNEMAGWANRRPLACWETLATGTGGEPLYPTWTLILRPTAQPQTTRTLPTCMHTCKQAQQFCRRLPHPPLVPPSPTR